MSIVNNLLVWVGLRIWYKIYLRIYWVVLVTSIFTFVSLCLIPSSRETFFHLHGMWVNDTPALLGASVHYHADLLDICSLASMTAMLCLIFNLIVGIFCLHSTFKAAVENAETLMSVCISIVLISILYLANFDLSRILRPQKYLSFHEKILCLIIISLRSLFIQYVLLKAIYLHITRSEGFIKVFLPCLVLLLSTLNYWTGCFMLTVVAVCVGKCIHGMVRIAELRPSQLSRTIILLMYFLGLIIHGMVLSTESLGRLSIPTQQW